MEMSSERLREGGVLVPEWWKSEAAARVADLGLRHEDIAVLVAKEMGLTSLVQSRISKALRGQNATIAILDALSRVLRIAPPVLAAATPAEAAAMDAARTATRTREQLLASGKAKLAAIRQKGVDLQHQRGVRTSPHGEDEGRIGGSGVARRRGASAG